MKTTGLIKIVIVALIAALPGFAQTSPESAAAAIENAEVHATFAADAGARTYAPAIYEDAMVRLERARSELNEGNEAASSRAAIQSAEASMAAEAKSKWRNTVAEIRTLRSDLSRLGAELTPLDLDDEDAILLSQPENSRDRVEEARKIVAMAKALRPAGAEAEELERADTLLSSAEKIVKQTKNNAVADHLSYVASMMARQAIYLTHLRELSGVLPELRLRRTELAQAEAARQAEQARLEREQAERELELMRQRLEQEQSRRAAEQVEIRRLRENLQKQQEMLAAQLTGARTARVEAEQRLDLLRAQYESALRSSESDAEQIEQLRQRVEDQELRLEQVRGEERQSEQALLREIEALRADLRQERDRGQIPEEELRRQEQQLRDRQAEIEALRLRRTQEMAERQKAEVEFEKRIARAELEMRMMAERSAELEESLAAERKAREEAEQELVRMRAEIEERERIERQRLEEMEAMKTRLAELAETRSDERGFIVSLPGLFFDTGKATLKEGTKANLAKIAELLEQMKRVRIIVEGHTDSVGSAEMNQKLSEARADAVRDFLVNSGVAPTGITNIGRGESQPIAPNDTAEGRSKNRRVEIVIEEIE